MRLIITYILLLGIATAMNAQEDKPEKSKGAFGITFASFGGDELLHFQNLVGAASYGSDNFFAIGVNYVRGINKWLDFETSLEFSKHNMYINGSSLSGEYTPSRKVVPKLINIPLTVRANFLKYFFANGGIMVDIDVADSDDYDKQTGLGAMMGIGAKYDFSSGLSVFVNPYIKGHSLLPFTTDNYHRRLMNAGIRLGVMYNFR